MHAYPWRIDLAEIQHLVQLVSRMQSWFCFEVSEKSASIHDVPTGAGVWICPWCWNKDLDEARGVTKRRRRKILPVHTRNDECFLIKSDVHRKHPLQSTYVHLMCSSQLPSQSRGFESAQEFSPHTCHRERFNKLELNLHGSTRRFSQLRLSNVFYWNLRACYWTILPRYSDFI